jgi:TRAP-type C4-dicarboxylate transport system permease large subunit
VPDLAADRAVAHIGSPLLFLVGLNPTLLIAACVMDVFSAIAVLTPLLLPILGVMLVFVLAITYLPLVVAFPGF